MLFPAAYGPDNDTLVGTGALKEIKRGEAFVFVPGKILITVEKAKSSEIGYIFSSHDKIFKSTADREFLILLVYMIYEN